MDDTNALYPVLTGLLFYAQSFVTTDRSKRIVQAWSSYLALKRAVMAATTHKVLHDVGLCKKQPTPQKRRLTASKPYTLSKTWVEAWVE